LSFIVVVYFIGTFPAVGVGCFVFVFLAFAYSLDGYTFGVRPAELAPGVSAGWLP
jgi:hypothetical protein